MDHSMPDHSMPDHSDHSMPAMCSMNMLFTWNYENTCIVFKWWHIRSLALFIMSFFLIIFISMGYEFFRSKITRWESKQLLQFNNANSDSSAFKQFKLKKSILYGFQVGYSFMLMLVFMTYNGWLMLAVVFGAALGNRIWDNSFNGMNCH